MVTEVSHFTIVVLLYDMYRYCQRLYGRRGAEDNWCMWLEMGHIAMYITVLLIFGRAKKKFIVLNFQGYK